MNAGDLAIAFPVCLLMFCAGIAPQFLFNIFNSTVVRLSQLFV